MNTLKLYLTISFCIVSISLKAQNEQLHYDIKWCEKRAFFAPKIKTSDKSNKYMLYFAGAIYNHYINHLPVFSKVIPISSVNKSAELINEKYVGLTQKDISKVCDINKISEKIRVENEIVYVKKQKLLKFYFNPMRKNPISRQYEKLVSFDIQLVDTKNKKATKKFENTYKNSSILSSGKWIKIKIDRSGVYKLTFDELKDLGINNASDIRVFGNGGKILPFYNNKPKPDDLEEVKIFIKDNTVYFYAEGVVHWKYNKDRDVFKQNINLYSNYAYYFLSSDYNSGTDNKIKVGAEPQFDANISVNTFNALAYHEKDSINLIGSGRLWVGEVLDFTTEYNFSFDMPNLVKGSKIKLSASLIARSPTKSSFDISFEGAGFSTTIPAVNYSHTSKYALQKNDEFETIATGSDKIDVKVVYNKSTASSEAWIDYLTINARRKLEYEGEQLDFRDTKSVGSNNISQFNIDKANDNVLVWDITNNREVKQIKTNINGSLLEFKQTTDTLKEFIAFELSKAYLPITKGDDVGLISNQNLHGIKQADLVIVSPDEFMSFANELKQIHNKNDNLKVVVVSTSQVYNEFSSGAPDVSAIRNFMKMLYDRAKNDAELPKYLCLFGDGSYDNKHIFDNNTNFILTYQSANSLSPTQSFVTDDYFGLLDDNEGEHIGMLDIGIGRFPVKNKTEAEAMIQKIRNYNSIEALGEWRNRVCFIADDEDANLHMSQANTLSKIVKERYSYLNVEKIFLDAYTQHSSSKGQRYPDAVLDIDNTIDKGVLIMNYTGHGDKAGLTEERIITTEQTKKWQNVNKLPVFMTATCEFSRFDHFEETTAGEHVFLNPKGGAIAMFTTTRLVYASPNFELNAKFYDYIFENNPATNKKYRLGDIMRLTKNAVGSDINKRNFTLLGDPALRISYPKHYVKTKTINQHGISKIDTLKAFSKVSITGEVQDKYNKLITNYNGILYATVFDKSKTVKSLNNDGEGVFEFKTWNSKIFRGKASVKNGVFKFNFIVPKDIKYNIDTGKISYYAENHEAFKDSKGSFNKILIGSIADNAGSEDKIGPEIEIYLNDENFVNGGITNSNPNLLVLLKDASGINTTGEGIGHNIEAVIDTDKNKKHILNDHYETNIDDFTSGEIKYKLPNLQAGEHTIRIKAWDVFNNSSVDSIRFRVIETKNFAISHVLNYPNPFSTNTSFFFEHNRPNDELEVFIHIFTVSGKIVKTIHTEVLTNAYRSNGIAWDGKDDFGNIIGRGVYFYKISVRTSLGEKAEKTSKLLIIN